MTHVKTQYKAVREGVGLIDRSDVGKIAVYGKDRYTWLQGMVSNDVKHLASQGVYSSFSACVLDATGHILTDVSLVRVNRKPGQRLAESLHLPVAEFVLADLPRENVNKIMSLWERFIIMEDVELKDVSESLGCVSFQGKNAYNMWDMASPLAEEPMYAFWHSVYTMPADHVGKHMGFDAYFPAQEKQHLWNILNGEGYPTISAEAQEILRIEAGIPKYGVDMDETTLAPEAGLMATHISLTKGCYVGQEIVARIDSRGHTNRALTGLVFEMGDVPMSGDKIVAFEEGGGTRETGRITSAIAASPALNGRPIALSYVRHEHRAPGTRLQVLGAKQSVTAQVVELPFYRRPEPK